MNLNDLFLSGDLMCVSALQDASFNVCVFAGVVLLNVNVLQV